MSDFLHRCFLNFDFCFKWNHIQNTCMAPEMLERSPNMWDTGNMTNLSHCKHLPWTHGPSENLMIGLKMSEVLIRGSSSCHDSVPFSESFKNPSLMRKVSCAANWIFFAPASIKATACGWASCPSNTATLNAGSRMKTVSIIGSTLQKWIWLSTHNFPQSKTPANL